MRHLSFILILIFASSVLMAQSPHGNNFDRDCQECHSTDDWKINFSKMSFKHAETGFELIGQHAIVECKSCHQTLVFAEVKGKNECFNCHNDIHENTVGKDCSKCHTPKTWIIEKVNDLHRASRFPLLGNHANLDCKQCHRSASNLRFEPLGIKCFDCHSSTYYATKNPNHVNAKFSTDCQQCHSLTAQGWSAQSSTHDFFPLTGGHAILNCFACHSRTSYAGLNQQCYSCHQSNFDLSVSPNHTVLNFSKNCQTCHTIETAAWKPAPLFNHDSYYQLIGAHSSIKNNCTQCHSSGYFASARKCVNCHQSNFDSSVNPNHNAAGFSTDCASCHSQNSWKPATFDHDGQYFPIYSGKHLSKWNNCSDCHTSTNNYKIFECINCHDHNKSETDLNHKGVSGYSYLSSACYTCHPKGSQQGSINHSLTNFPLLGAHSTVPCTQCHQTTYAGTSTACSSCHQNKYTAAPNHSSQNYSLDCTQCHNSADWKQISFNHSSTAFQLTGAHINVSCTVCHSTKLTGTPKDCYSCHQTKYNSAANHTAQSYPKDCTQCHNTSSWQGASFNHQTTAFPLTGAHTSVVCANCHPSTYKGTPTICSSCHLTKYQSTTNPNHVVKNIPNTCEQCHTTNPGWKPATFPIHSNYFQLLGAHTSVSCTSCHKGNYAIPAPTQCYGCHQTDYNNVSNPNHAVGKFPTTCEQCHTATVWKPSTFNHSLTTFQLTGAHVTVSCNLCHTNGYSGGTANDCYSCHQTKYSSAPNHTAQSYPHDCTQCHTTISWQGAGFNHSSTAFPLTGAHTSVACANCHTSTYKGTPTICSSCHLTKYQSTTNPNHVANNIPNTCEQCHTTNPGWKPATFTMHNNYFQLLGAHTSVSCASCHKGNYATPAPILCFGCHQTDYNNVTNPNHAVGKFPTTCEQCHTTTVWKPSTFNHDAQYFPINSGKHLGKWNTCSDCHTSQSNYNLFECINCHEHNKSGTDSEHKGVSGYSYQSVSCYACHPRGTKEGSINHSLTNFPLVGLHLAVPCSQCHQTKYIGTPQDCNSCHSSDYQSSSSPNHVLAKYPTTCEQCHTPTGWKPSTFNHSTTAFPLTGAHTSVNCSNCHTTTFKGTPTVCSSCHFTKYQNTTNPNHVAKNIPNTCDQCHTTVPGWKPATFPIHSNYFSLLGAHTLVACTKCHNGNYATPAPTLCIGCHQTNYNSVANPNHVTNKFSTDCIQCHNTTVWKPSTFNHSTTPFVLTGYHTSVSCVSCHTVGYSVGQTPNSCIGCHQTNYNSVTNPNHVTNKFSTDCTQCHNTTVWKPSTFNHSTTPFILTGYHTSVSCVSCHTVGYSVGQTPNTCIGCHQTNYNSVTNPNHVTNKFSTDCTQCHNTTVWKPSTFNHSTTPFVLTGYHTSVSCASCHTVGYSVGQTPNTCIGCHQTNYNSVTNPNHVTNKFSTDCTQCHNTTVWKPSTFNHSTTPFVLTGYHTSVSCVSCHTVGYSVGQTPNTCIGCHQTNYNSVTNPNHVTNKFSTDCTQCHNTTVWKPSTFNHSTTPFILTGYHTSVSCVSCHTVGYSVGQTPNTCIGCHQTNYNSVVTPNHITNKFSTDCTQCHNTTVWKPSTFNHSTTPFILTGYHTSVPCVSCHTVGYSVGQTPNTCIGCHQTNYNSVTNPNHVTNKFSTDCTQCHNTTVWKPSTFNHSTTPFVLTGYHTSVSCVSCHTVGYSVGQTPNTCIGCHQTNYNSVTNPNHVTNKFSTDCTQCHNTTVWKPSTFNHSTTPFVLTGYHTSVSCASCHTVGYNVGQTPNTCIGCHQTIYNTATSPNHVTNKFSTDCTQCHNTTVWQPSTFNHSTTPFILTGYHTTVSCISCHTVGYSVGQTPNTCFGCHQPNYNATLNPNHVLKSIPNTCEQCHTTNVGWKPASFPIHNNYYQLLGAHTSVACINCHNGNYTTPAPTLCYGCHQANYNNAANPNHVAALFPTDCTLCHSQNVWRPSTFNHDGQYFPIYSGKHIQAWTNCSDCHYNQSNYFIFSCINCHEHNNQTDLNDKHKTIPNYVYTATSCYTCHPAGLK